MYSFWHVRKIAKSDF